MFAGAEMCKARTMLAFQIVRKQNVSCFIYLTEKALNPLKFISTSSAFMTNLLKVRILGTTKFNFVHSRKNSYSTVLPHFLSGRLT